MSFFSAHLSAQEYAFRLTRAPWLKKAAIRSYHHVGEQLARRFSRIPGIERVILRGGSLHDCDPALSDIDFTIVLETEDKHTLESLRDKYVESKKLFPMLGELLISEKRFWRFNQLLPTPAAESSRSGLHFKSGESVSSPLDPESSLLARFLCALIPYFANQYLEVKSPLARARYARNARKIFSLLGHPGPMDVAIETVAAQMALEIPLDEVPLSLEDPVEGALRLWASNKLGFDLHRTPHRFVWSTPRAEGDWRTDWEKLKQTRSLPPIALVPPALGSLINRGIGNPASPKILEAPLPAFLHVLYAANLIPIGLGLTVYDSKQSEPFLTRLNHHLAALGISASKGYFEAANALLRGFPVVESLE